MLPSPPDVEATTSLRSRRDEFRAASTSRSRYDVRQSTGRVGPDQRTLAWVYAVGGLIGFVAAFTLLVEKIALLKDPSYVPSCSINPIINCGSIMRTDQAEVFGFPNPMIGIAGFAIVATVGVALLAGASFRPWFWWGLQAGTVGGIVFVHWLIFQSLYRIDALCPYCMVVWVVTIPIFWYTTLYSIRRSRLPATSTLGRLTRLLGEYHGVVVTVWYMAIAAVIAQRFWDYWSTLLS